MLLEFPSETEWRELANSYPYEKLEVSKELFPYTAHPVGSIERFAAVPGILVWSLHLKNRLAQTRWSHMMFTYYFNKGIPDEVWMISPGRKGQSVEFYPNFQLRDHFIKSAFDYYSDVFYYKLFSAWDNLGHLLDVQHDLNIRRPTFAKAVNTLEARKHPLGAILQAIRSSPDFVRMTEFRHSATHNELLGHIGIGMKKTSDGVTFGTGGYTPSAQIKDNAIKSLDLFCDVIEALKSYNSTSAICKDLSNET